MAAVPPGTARFSLGSYDQAWCADKLRSYNGASDAGDSMKVGALAFSVVLMMLLGFTLLCSGFVRLFLGRQTLNLFLGRYNLYPAVRVLMRVTFVLFLPLLSSVFSLAKAGGHGGTELLLMLLWMLLIELIRKKVLVMVLPTDGSSFSRGIGRFTLMDYADEVAHVMWVGYLVYSNTQDETGAVMKAMFAILWSLSLVKLLQRAANTYIAGRSYHTARNPLVIAGYMQYVMEEEKLQGRSSSSACAPDPAATGSTVMKMCKFVVQGENKVVIKKKAKGEAAQEQQPKFVTTLGHGNGAEADQLHDHNEEKHVGLDIDLAKIDELVTVGKIWGWGLDGHRNAKLFSPGQRRLYLENLCLSFSLFKMLRRRFEKYPMVEVGSAMARRMMLKGLLCLDDDGQRPFQVLQQELDFVENYYQAADHVVMSRPLLFFVNVAFSMLFVPIYLLAVLAILISNRDAAFLYCMARGWSGNVDMFPLILYLSITLALVATLICIEASEFFTSYFFSNWNTVRLVCLYGSLPSERWLSRKLLYYLISLRFLVSTVLQFLVKLFFRHQADPATVKINQVSIVSACGPLDKIFSAWTYQVTLAKDAKKKIIKSLKDIDEIAGTISLPPPPPHGMLHDESTGRIKSVTEIILATHLATELFEMEHLEMEKEKKLQDDDDSARIMATTLSRYCMYMVAHLPFLLPDDETWVSKKMEDMRNCLTKVLQQCGGCTMCTPNPSCKDAMAKSLKKSNWNDLEDPTTQDAMKMLETISNWDDLAGFWVKLLIYLAPSNDIEGHAKAVANSGGDLITYLWAFCTHAGITRHGQPTSGDHAV